MKIIISPRYDGNYSIRIITDEEKDYGIEKISQRVALKEWLSWLDIWCYSAPKALDSYELPKETRDFLYSDYFDHLIKRMYPETEIIKY